MSNLENGASDLNRSTLQAFFRDSRARVSGTGVEVGNHLSAPLRGRCSPPPPQQTAAYATYQALCALSAALNPSLRGPAARELQPHQNQETGLLGRPCSESNASARYNSFCFILYLKPFDGPNFTIHSFNKRSSAMVDAPTSPRRPPCPRVDCRSEDRTSHIQGWGQMRDDLRPDYARPRPSVD